MAAYSREPRTKRSDKWGFVSKSNIETWRGNPRDIGQVCADALEDLKELRDSSQLAFDLTTGGRGFLFEALITSTTGKQRKCSSPREFDSVISQSDWEKINTIRVEVGGATKKVKLSVIARRRIPGVVIVSHGSSELLVQGIAEFIHGRLMEGYVDRLESWRGIAAFSMPLILIPLAVVFSDIAAGLAKYLQIVFLLFIVGATIPLIAVGIRVFQVKVPVEFSDAKKLSMTGGLIGGVKRFLQDKWVLRVLYLAGAILIGVVSSKLSELIPFP